MKIWVDADACPNVIKEILYRAAKRLQIQLTLVANAPLQVPGSPYVEWVQVRSGFDVADNYIVQQMSPGELVITADIPLAANAIAKGGYVLSPRGEFYDKGNIRERLSMRNFMESLRNSGIETGGPAAMSSRDRETFANQLDRFLTKYKQ
ncbi:MAG: YaiI/YqxD family protein [Leptolyngbyaceae cyanobacterium]